MIEFKAAVSEVEDTQRKDHPQGGEPTGPGVHLVVPEILPSYKYITSIGDPTILEQEVVTMQQQIQRPVRRTETQRPSGDQQEVWPQSARQFMKLPVSGLLSAGKRLSFRRLSSPPDPAA